MPRSGIRNGWGRPRRDAEQKSLLAALYFALVAAFVTACSRSQLPRDVPGESPLSGNRQVVILKLDDLVPLDRYADAISPAGAELPSFSRVSTHPWESFARRSNRNMTPSTSGSRT